MPFRLMIVSLSLTLSLTLSLVGGCARVKPWQREKLASPAMMSGLSETNSMSTAYRAKVLESKTGGGLPGTAPGGGCGCSQ